MVASTLRQSRVKLAKNFEATGPWNSRETRVKLAINHFQATGPWNSLKLASNAYMPFQLNFIYEYMHVHLNIHTYMQVDITQYQRPHSQAPTFPFYISFDHFLKSEFLFLHCPWSAHFAENYIGIYNYKSSKYTCIHASSCN
jgi:hypothetical protein